MNWSYQVMPGREPVQVLPLPVAPRPRLRPSLRILRLIELILRNIRRKERQLARTRREVDRRLLRRSIAAERRQLRLLLGMHARSAGFAPSLSEIQPMEEPAAAGPTAADAEVAELMEGEMEVAEELREAMAEADDEEARMMLMEMHMETMETLAGLAAMAGIQGTVAGTSPGG
ncbi:hypothetical protein [Limnochorda pilosa]|uniref:Uncharacterized protein n=1 Tax=Limnochorda pilosa TaxID=1555112 RepID=A0A0K2SJK4_LIMPI|nr:hypothetical protein [Limnochorda pilosa]BAS27293.1 hypothetical protein LIP_1444 [Limnochorda pilosa]